MKRLKYIKQLSANTHYCLKALAIVFLLMLLSAQCMKRAIIFQQEKPILIDGTITVEDAIHFLNKKYPQYNTDSLPWQYAYIKEFDDGNSLLKVVWKEDYEDPIFTDIIVWTNNDTINGVLFEVYPDTNYLWEKKIILGEGHNTRYYVYDDDFTGVMAMGDLKTHELIEGRVYEDAKIVGYIYPNTSPTTKAFYKWNGTIPFFTRGAENGGMLPNVTVTTSYGSGIGGGLGFPSTSFGGGISGGSYSGGSGGAGGLNGSQSSNTNSQRQSQLKTPCDQMKLLTAKSSFQNMLKGLNEKLSANIEYGYTYWKNGAEYESKLFEGNAGKVPMSANPSKPIDGYLHTHYEINGMNATGYIFSIDDIWLIASLYNQQCVRDITTFSIGVVTPKNTYILKVADLESFKAFAQKYKDLQTLKDALGDGKYENGSRYEDIYEPAILNFINDFNAGLILYKADTKTGSFNEWKSPAVSSDRKTITNNGCN